MCNCYLDSKALFVSSALSCSTRIHCVNQSFLGLPVGNKVGSLQRGVNFSAEQSVNH